MIANYETINGIMRPVTPTAGETRPRFRYTCPGCGAVTIRTHKYFFDHEGTMCDVCGAFPNPEADEDQEG